MNKCPLTYLPCGEGKYRIEGLRRLHRNLASLEDLKNFSVITRNGRVELSPAYDLLNTTLILGKTADELALMLAGKRREFRRRELVDYFGLDKLALTPASIQKVLQEFEAAFPTWLDLLERSFLAEDLKQGYRKLLETRIGRLALDRRG